MSGSPECAPAYVLLYCRTLVRSETLAEGVVPPVRLLLATTNSGTLETNSSLYANFGTNPPAMKWIDIYNNGGGVISDIGVKPTNQVPTRFYRAR